MNGTCGDGKNWADFDVFGTAEKNYRWVVFKVRKRLQR